MTGGKLMVIGAAIAVATAVGCGSNGTPAAPSTTPATTPPSSVPSTAARLVDGVTDQPIAGATVTGDGVTPATSALTGSVTIAAPAGTGSVMTVTIKAGPTVDRQTNVKVPGADAVVSLIPTGFDLAAFNEMFRAPQLLRWRSAPPLRVQGATLQFTSVTMGDGLALSDAMTNTEQDDLVADLAWALPQLTGAQFASFVSVDRSTAAAGQTVSMLNTGFITVQRVAGLTSATGYWGYSRWFYLSDGTVYGGLMMLDRDFERSGSPFRRSLRAHELGHALGCNHVTVRPSVMNSAARIEPNDFDHQASRLAFQRSPGNVAPDIDPAASFSVNALRTSGRWSAPIY